MLLTKELLNKINFNTAMNKVFKQYGDTDFESKFTKDLFEFIQKFIYTKNISEIICFSLFLGSVLRDSIEETSKDDNKDSGNQG